MEWNIIGTGTHTYTHIHHTHVHVNTCRHKGICKKNCENYIHIYIYIFNIYSSLPISHKCSHSQHMRPYAMRLALYIFIYIYK